MKQTGLSYAQAYDQELTANPDLYKRHEEEVRAGSTYSVPQPYEWLDPSVKRRSA